MRVTEKRQVVRPCDESERDTHSEKNARCGHTREKKLAERGQCNKQCIMEE